MKDNFWTRVHVLPTQDDFLDVENVNPADAYRKQADAINESGPLYAQLESLEQRLQRVDLVYKELRTKVLAQSMPVPSSSTRTNDLVDAFILSQAKIFKTKEGMIKDISEMLVNLEKRKLKLEGEIAKVNRRLRAIEALADKCDRIMNWAKHEARLEYRG